MVVAYSTTFRFKWRQLAANFLPYFFFHSFFCVCLFPPPAFHSQKRVCQTDPFLMNCLLENRSNHRQPVVRLQWETAACLLPLAGGRRWPCGAGGGCKWEFRGALCPISSSSLVCIMQWICSVVLMQEARYLLRVLFVKLEKSQALEDGRNLYFFCVCFHWNSKYSQFLTLKHPIFP